MNNIGCEKMSGSTTTRTMCNFAVVMIIVGYVAGQSFIATPENATAKIGGTATFDCGLIFGSPRTMAWKFNGQRIYSFLGGEEDYPMKNPHKYPVVRNGDAFRLTVMNLGFEDGGIYICQSLLLEASAVLIVLGKPALLNYTFTPTEGHTVEYECGANFGGPSAKDISPDHFPELKTSLDNHELGSTKNASKPTNEDKYYYIFMAYNLTVDAAMHGKPLLCDIGTTYPRMNVTAFIELNVFYSVRNTSFSPIKTNYEIGSNIACTADGNPYPSFEWKSTTKSCRTSIHRQIPQHN